MTVPAYKHIPREPHPNARCLFCVTRVLILIVLLRLTFLPLILTTFFNIRFQSLLLTVLTCCPICLRKSQCRLKLRILNLNTFYHLAEHDFELDFNEVKFTYDINYVTEIF